MNKQKVTSREYKVMLAASRFIGNEQQLISKAGSFGLISKRQIIRTKDM